MKTYMPLNGLRWSRNSGSANCDMPQSAVFGRPGGVGVVQQKKPSLSVTDKEDKNKNYQETARLQHQSVSNRLIACSFFASITSAYIWVVLTF